MLKSIFIFATVVSISLLFGCEKSQPNAEELPGEWVATEEADTIYIMDESNFYHSTKNMHYDHYDYSIKGDSILVGYSGMMMILVQETKHYFELKGDELMIDFSNRYCFGFPKEKMHYRRVQKIILE
jgi:hypothetical protein